jgi:hypothetical protein
MRAAVHRRSPPNLEFMECGVRTWYSTPATYEHNKIQIFWIATKYIAKRIDCHLLLRVMRARTYCEYYYCARKVSPNVRGTAVVIDKCVRA